MQKTSSLIIFVIPQTLNHDNIELFQNIDFNNYIVYIVIQIAIITSLKVRTRVMNDSK